MDGGVGKRKLCERGVKLFGSNLGASTVCYRSFLSGAFGIFSMASWKAPGAPPATTPPPVKPVVPPVAPAAMPQAEGGLDRAKGRVLGFEACSRVFQAALEFFLDFWGGLAIGPFFLAFSRLFSSFSSVSQVVLEFF